MAAGYVLREGYFENRSISDDEIWSIFSYVFSSHTKNTTSYKFGFLKALLDNLYNVDSELSLSFEQIFYRFAEEYWNLILKYGIRQNPVNIQGRRTALENAICSAAESYRIEDSIPFESLSPQIRQEVARNVRIQCGRYVVGALFEDTRRLFYSFSLAEGRLQFNPVFYRFVCSHKLVIEKLNYYEWARYLEKVNVAESARNLLSKIDESSRRENLSYYRDILFNEFEAHTCFYCGRRLVAGKIHVDHFIPWSFIKDDNLWNFVLSCSRCNEKKSDRLAGRPFLDSIVRRNELITNHEHDMLNYDGRKLVTIYDWAYRNGYNRIWIP